MSMHFAISLINHLDMRERIFMLNETNGKTSNFLLVSLVTENHTPLANLVTFDGHASYTV